MWKSIFDNNRFCVCFCDCKANEYYTGQCGHCIKKEDVIECRTHIYDYSNEHIPIYSYISLVLTLFYEYIIQIQLSKNFCKRKKGKFLSFLNQGKEGSTCTCLYSIHQHIKNNDNISVLAYYRYDSRWRVFD